MITIMATRQPRQPATRTSVEDAQELIDSLLKLKELAVELVDVPEPLVNWVRSKQLTNPMKEFGQRGLEDRIAGLRVAVDHAFSAGDPLGRQGVLEIIDRLDRAVQVAGTLPLLKRKRFHLRIDRELDNLENALVDAVLPRHRPSN
jgi:hypothetical protein